MHIKDFVENYPLYKPFELNAEYNYLHELPKPAINLGCEHCKGEQTFNMINEYYYSEKHSSSSIKNDVHRAIYKCACCQIFQREFFYYIDKKGKTIRKVGQYPAWEITGDKDIEKLLGKHASHYKKGLTCESQGYGIAAFAYYRRITEEIIDSLLDDIADLISDDEKSKYDIALGQTKKTRNTSEKIDLVKDLLPSILRPEGLNPLSILHTNLSEGLHAESDEECMKIAAQIRSILKYLVHQVTQTAKQQKEFSTSMRNILDKKADKN